MFVPDGSRNTAKKLEYSWHLEPFWYIVPGVNVIQSEVV